MKFKGKTIKGPNVEYVVIPRNGEDIVFKCQAVLDYKRFEEMVPVPVPGKKLLPGGKTVDDFEDPGYLVERQHYAESRYNYMVVESLKDNPDIEWEKVRQDAPETWSAWKDELKDSGFTDHEMNAILIGISTANSFNQEKLEEAKKRFLASLTESNSVPL